MPRASLRTASIRSKLVASSVVVTSLALVLACLSFILYDVVTFRDALARKLSTQAEMVGLNSLSALLFQDAESATSTLKALRVEPQILTAAIYSKEGALFARFSQNAGGAALPVPEALGDRIDQHRFERGHLIVFRRILSEQEPVGMVYLESDLSEGRTRVQRYAVIAALVLLLSLAAAMAFSFRLQRMISEPILHLAATAREVSANKNYSVRAAKERDDETGVLVDAFNEMLGQIQRRDTALTVEIAERRRAEAELEQARDAALEASHLKTAFLANMSHEIRTPLNVILGYTRLIADHLADSGDPSQGAAVEALEHGSTRLLNTVRGILDISKIETGNFDLQPKRIEVGPFVEREVADIGRLAAKKGLSLDTRIDVPAAVITFDEYCLSHALMNLLDNAIKFTEKGAVSVWLGRVADGRLCIEVRDTGVGIEPEYLPRLYEVFSQEQSGNTRPFEGSGLGMALAKKFLELNRATISVESQKGMGSTIAILFSRECEESPPRAVLHDPSESPIAVVVPERSSASRSERPRILLVEDDPDTQNLMGALLRDHYEPMCATSGAEARSHLARDTGEIRMVLMDLSLRGREDGFALTRFLRSEEKWKRLPIIAISAHARREDRERALASGCSAYLPKPLEKRELIALMASLIDRPLRA